MSQNSDLEVTDFLPGQALFKIIDIEVVGRFTPIQLLLGKNRADYGGSSGCGSPIAALMLHGNRRQSRFSLAPD